MGKPTAVMPQGGSFLLYEGKEGDPFWTKAETLLYCALLGYIIFEGAEEDRNMNTLVDMISGMEVKEDDEDVKQILISSFAGKTTKLQSRDILVIPDVQRYNDNGRRYYVP